MASFNIYGCCVCRDIFGFNPENEHEVVEFLQASSQIASFMFPEKPPKSMAEADMAAVTGMNNFRKRCIRKDYNKEVTKSFNKPSDFFIIDLINIADTNLKKEVFDDGNEHYFTASKWFVNAYKNGLSDFFGNRKLETVNRIEYIEEHGFDDTLDRLINWLTVEKGYKQEQIILIETKRVPVYKDKDRLFFFEPGTRKNVNHILDKIYVSFKNKCPGCHAITMPDNTYADSGNRWGLTDLHENPEYYEYLYRSIDAIVNDIDCDKIIEKYREEYSEKNYIKIKQLLKNSIFYLEEKGLLNSYINEENFTDDFEITKTDKLYLAPKGAKLFVNKNGDLQAAALEEYTAIANISIPYSCVTLSQKKQNAYVLTECCERGICGSGINLNDSWVTVNKATCVIFKDTSIILKHSGTASLAQVNIINTLKNFEILAGEMVTFSVWARVLEISNDKKYPGGTISIINASDYNKGNFYASKIFSNTEWKEVSLSVRLPEKADFAGLTLCIRANVGKGENRKDAVVEICQPRLQLGLKDTPIFTFRT